jgi:small multidrug resistance family-3 protein
MVFAWALTRVESSYAGRTFAAYGGVYVAAALAWLVVVERVRPDRWDLLGVGLCLAGTVIIILAPR